MTLIHWINEIKNNRKGSHVIKIVCFICCEHWGRFVCLNQLAWHSQAHSQVIISAGPFCRYFILRRTANRCRQNCLCTQFNRHTTNQKKEACDAGSMTSSMSLTQCRIKKWVHISGSDHNWLKQQHSIGHCLKPAHTTYMTVIGSDGFIPANPICEWIRHWNPMWSEYMRIPVNYGTFVQQVLQQLIQQIWGKQKTHYNFIKEKAKTVWSCLLLFGIFCPCCWLEPQ